MNAAVFRKTFGDSLSTLGLCAGGMVLFVILFVWAMLNMGTELLEFVARFTFIKQIFEMGFGISVEGEVSINMLFAICFTHGVVFALTWTVLIAAATRVTAGEVERGTADMLLTLPISRPSIYTSTSLVWMIASLVLAICPVIGIGIATQIFEMEEEVRISRYFAPAVNLFCLNLAVGSIAACFGSFSNRRGPAVGVAVAVVITSIVLNFLEPFIEFISTIKFLSLLNYFRPTDIVRTGEWPIDSMLVLLGLAAVTWTAGLVAFSRKDIPTA
ncbi:MAG: ABC transporter permease subunit [Planctomycetota bacterium]